MTAVVGVVMGSDSDMDTMRKAEKLLDEFGVRSEVLVRSAHRQHAALTAYVQSAEARGVGAYICGAGMAAATTLPVIGIPRALKTLDGLDSLLSIAQMPKGIPVACVAVGGAQNAALLAVTILAASDPDLDDKLRRYRQELAGV